MCAGPELQLSPVLFIAKAIKNGMYAVSSMVNAIFSA
jgi:hypothetical protein